MKRKLIGLMLLVSIIALLIKGHGKGWRWYLSTPLYAWRRCLYTWNQKGILLGRIVGIPAFRLRQSAAEATDNALVEYDVDQPLTSCLCNQAQIDSPTFRRWIDVLRRGAYRHRKTWELAYVSQVFWERELLQLKKLGLVFAVGEEPLPALFAGMGCQIVATDLGTDHAKAKGWIDTHQHASTLETLRDPLLCDDVAFGERVAFRAVDMNHIPEELRQEKFDFIWSTCSLEHLGSIRKGQDFILNAMECLRPGGTAVHTTEFNCTSNIWTLDHASSVFFRRRDIERIVERLRDAGHNIEIDYRSGGLPDDKFVDLPPYKSRAHLKLLTECFVCTSIGLIITKGAPTTAE